jgi:palmitoyltransferase ZDHHC9/14/18
MTMEEIEIARFLKTHNPIRMKDVWPAKDKFCCGDHVVKGNGVRRFSTAIILLIIPFLLLFSFTIFLYNFILMIISIAIGSVAIITTFCLMIRTACSDPGILKRYTAGEDEYYEQVVHLPQNTHKAEWPHYCRTCCCIRPLRSSHCR